MNEWKYKTIDRPCALTEKELNNIGEDGWELVTMNIYQTHNYEAHGNFPVPIFYYIFKIKIDLQ